MLVKPRYLTYPTTISVLKATSLECLMVDRRRHATTPVLREKRGGVDQMLEESEDRGILKPHIWRLLLVMLPLQSNVFSKNSK